MDDRSKIRRYILENFLFTKDESALADGASLLEGGIMDSTGALELIAFLEESFGIKVAEAEMLPDNLDSVDRLLAYLQRKRS